MGTIEVGELLYDYTVKLTSWTEYGASLQSVMEGAVVLPPEGVRFDVSFEGVSIGPKLRGKVRGVDYLQHENVTLFTSSKSYAWVNALQIWATGTADRAEQVVHIKGFST